jgi:hypothetical protein
MPTANQLQKRPPWRPTKYLPEIIFPKIEEYISSCGREQTELPTIEGLADHLGVTSETIREWANKYPDFSSTIKKITDKQKIQLMNDGMYGGKEVNAAMAIFLLKCNHHMNDGSNQTVNLYGDKVIAIMGGESWKFDKNVSKNDSDQKDIQSK